jgi:hypothetical protein
MKQRNLIKHYEALKKIEEGSLIWDEYKYRHDLIWKHLIRSTLAVFALIVVPYSSNLNANFALIVVASLLAIGYIVFTYFIIRKELKLYISIKKLHRIRQGWLFGLHKTKVGTFELRVQIYIFGLFIFVIVASAFNILHKLFQFIYKLEIFNFTV